MIHIANLWNIEKNGSVHNMKNPFHLSIKVFYTI
jgi:hypothetical protein